MTKEHLEFIGYLFAFVTLMLIFLTKVLQNKQVRNIIADAWISCEEKKGKVSTAKVIHFSLLVFSKIYEAKEGRLSIVKFLIIITTLNLPFVIYFSSMTTKSYNSIVKEEEINRIESIEVFGSYIPGSADGHAMDNLTIDFLLYTASFFIGVIIFEYISYKMTKKILLISKQKNNLLYLYVDILLLITAYYILPIAIYYNEILSHFYDENSWSSVHAETYMIFHLFPVAPAYYFFNDSAFLRYILIIPFLSVCLPTVIYLSAISLLSNKALLEKTSYLIEKIESYGVKSFEHIQWFISFFGAVLTIIAWNI